MLHAAVLRSPVARARVTSLDLEAARMAEGVRAVVGPDSLVPKVPLPYGTPYAMLTTEPSYAGQPIALIAAETAEQANAAVEAMALELEPLPHLLDPQEAVAGLKLAADPTEQVRGNVDAALAAAEVKVELELETPDHLQTPLEPHAAVARWEGDDLTVWVSTQGMFDARRDLAEAFGVAEDRVRVISEFVGGGFGSKQGAGFEAVAAAELARLCGRPVRLVNDRHEEQLDGGRRARSQQKVRLGARRDGTLVAADVEAVVDQGAEGGMLILLGMALAPAMLLYACESARAIGVMATTNRRGQNAFRAPGIVEGITAFEQAIDELAVALDLDPLELRRRNHAEHDQGSGLPYSGKRLLACYDRAAELAGWERRGALRDPQPHGLLRGMGCASQIWWGSGGPPAQATVRIDAAAHARVVTGIQDIGTGTLTAAQLVAAEELGLPLDHVRVVGGDTAHNIYGPVAGGSMTVPSVTPAVRAASARARRLLLDLAGDVLEISPDDLEVRAGRLRSRDGTLDVPVTDVTEKLGNATIDSSGSRVPNPEGSVVQTFGCQIAQVAVDPALGEVRVERIVAVHDVGRIVNPLGAASQVEGGVLQGIGYALSEELVVDPTTGTPVNAYLDDYKLPTIADTPEIIVDFIDLPDEAVPNLGARGLGEPPIIPTAAAVANAFAHATGRRCNALPMTRARVLEALA
jgi:xanthine dehydrogenase YagR molybdenum-binding subunit